jgi:hypothetical protein
MAKANSKSNTMSPDAALIRLGSQLHQQIEEAYSHWEIMARLKAPLHKKLDRLRSVFSDDWNRREKLHADFDRTAAGRRADREYKAFCKADTQCHRTARAIMRKQPRTIAGAAVLALAALFDGDWGGFGFQADDAAGKVAIALSRAAKIKLPNGVRQAVRS